MMPVQRGSFPTSFLKSHVATKNSVLDVRESSVETIANALWTPTLLPIEKAVPVSVPERVGVAADSPEPAVTSAVASKAGEFDDIPKEAEILSDRQDDASPVCLCLANRLLTKIYANISETQPFKATAGTKLAHGIVSVSDDICIQPSVSQPHWESSTVQTHQLLLRHDTDVADAEASSAAPGCTLAPASFPRESSADSSAISERCSQALCHSTGSRGSCHHAALVLPHSPSAPADGRKAKEPSSNASQGVTPYSFFSSRCFAGILRFMVRRPWPATRSPSACQEVVSAPSRAAVVAVSLDSDARACEALASVRVNATKGEHGGLPICNGEACEETLSKVEITREGEHDTLSACTWLARGALMKSYSSALQIPEATATVDAHVVNANSSVTQTYTVDLPVSDAADMCGTPQTPEQCAEMDLPTLTLSECSDESTYLSTPRCDQVLFRWTRLALSAVVSGSRGKLGANGMVSEDDKDLACITLGKVYFRALEAQGLSQTADVDFEDALVHHEMVSEGDKGLACITLEKVYLRALEAQGLCQAADADFEDALVHKSREPGGHASAPTSPSVAVVGAKKVGGVTSFMIEVGEETPRTVFKRYSHFKELDRILRPTLTSSSLPLLPPQSLIIRKNFSKEFKAKRQRGLSDYLAAVIATDPSMSQPALRRFLSMPSATCEGDEGGTAMERTRPWYRRHCLNSAQIHP
eukprot:TRINITY_DN12037_c0_g2_i2.p1 TRINITY_DN12037_c0_g2~~TRINITY_DN12037_c0_g2_i2.p1  ORF type:complete len:702 (+),score=68.98 TRINITY_DN12037_c0_g2_i2:370-2475(+)